MVEHGQSRPSAHARGEAVQIMTRDWIVFRFGTDRRRIQRGRRQSSPPARRFDTLTRGAQKNLRHRAPNL